VTVIRRRQDLPSAMSRKPTAARQDEAADPEPMAPGLRLQAKGFSLKASSAPAP
jgi:hypothetical protein